MAVAEALRNSVERFANRGLPGPRNYAQIPALVERGKARAAAFLDDLDAGLAGTPWLAGDFFSVADITAFVVVEFAAWVEVRPQPAHANLQRWHAAVAARPSASA
jgi:glutathione S-transferase